MQSVDPEEIERFSRLAGEWWDERGRFAPLHAIGPARLGFIRDQAVRHFGRDDASLRPLENLMLLDVGCGGGLVAEPMARLGSCVTAIDASEKNIAVARLHAEQSGLTIDYRCTSAEDLQAEGAQYDMVLALEIIEHVREPEAFVQTCLELCRPNGLLVFSTLNRTAKAFALAVVGAEYVLRWLPRGTHRWEKFVRPSELATWLRRHGGEVQAMTGLTLHPLTFQWSLNPKDLSVNYLLAAAKA